MNPFSQSTVKSVVVVGGGAAGWLTASILAAHSQSYGSAFSVTLIESPDIAMLGVGEGTWPTMRNTLRKIGINEDTFMVECLASFKQGSEFRQWVTGGQSDHYYHPFSLPHGFFDADTAGWWLSQTQKKPYAEQFSTQPTLCQWHKAPKQIQTPAYAAVANYGYHLDASRFADLLKRHGVATLGINHIVDHVDNIESANNGDISAVCGRTSGPVHGDLFIDCSGFNARLIGQHYGVELSPVRSVLRNNTALAVQASYQDSSSSIASATISTAQEAGWIWDIGLWHRKGVGYVFDGDACDDDTALAALMHYINQDSRVKPVKEGDVRKIQFTPGYRKVIWQQNCVAVGTSAGFIEPLEASALMLIETTANAVCEQIGAGQCVMQLAAKHVNQSMNQRWERIIDFLKLHYVLSQRQDTPYWRYMSDITTASEQLQHWLAMWQYRVPLMSDFTYADELFPAASYLYVLYGMGYNSTLTHATATHPQVQQAKQFTEQVQQLSKQQLSGLPGNRELLAQIRQRAASVAG